MAFDAGMVAAVAAELSEVLSEAKIERIQQPAPDEVILQLHKDRRAYRLLIAAGAHQPRICLTEEVRENPAVPPMFCMLLRKHLGGAKIAEVHQIEFERILELVLDSYDEMGFPCRKYLILEIMGKYSNLIFCNAQRSILGAMRLVDFTTSQKRQILPGLHYQMPPSQGKADPRTATAEDFLALALSHQGDPPAKWISACYTGISTFSAREIAARSDGTPASLWQAFSAFMERIAAKRFEPLLLTDPAGIPTEFSFFPVQFCLPAWRAEKCASFSELIHLYYGEKARAERMQQRSADITHLLHTAEARLEKKILLQEEELRQTEEMSDLQRCGDLITANLWKLKRGDQSVLLTDYSSGEPQEVALTLDGRLSPAQNAQRYYKRYRKAKTANEILQTQIAAAKEELLYLATVSDSVTRAETEADLDEIRRELATAGYLSKEQRGAARKQMNHRRQAPKHSVGKPMTFRTDGGLMLLCGKNNTQNDHLTTKVAEKSDFWFHVKHHAGAHVILLCEGKTPSATDLTQAAVVAATYSDAHNADRVEVDYTPVRFVKKPAGSKPGYVIYLQNQTAYVRPDPALAERLRQEK